MDMRFRLPSTEIRSDLASTETRIEPPSVEIRIAFVSFMERVAFSSLPVVEAEQLAIVISFSSMPFSGSLVEPLVPGLVWDA